MHLVGTDIICIVELGPKEHEENGVGIVDRDKEIEINLSLVIILHQVTSSVFLASYLVCFLL